MDWSRPLEPWARMRQGTLANGFKYVVVPNATPPGRFDAQLQVCVGSLAEEEHEQGLAHYLEHAVFLGTEKYPNAEIMRNLFASWGMSFGGDANAYTDFRSTVYTFNAPTSLKKRKKRYNKKRRKANNKKVAEKSAIPQATAKPTHTTSATPTLATTRTTPTAVRPEEESTLWKVIDAMHQLAFKALLLQEHADAERGSILSEAQLSNSIGYRVEYQEYQQIHARNLLSQRFPIGRVDQIAKFSAEDLRRFYRKWYRPDNMCLYLAGDVRSTDDVINAIETIFGPQSSGDESERPPLPVAHFTTPSELMCVFQHPLLHQFEIAFNHLFPLTPIKTMHDIKLAMMYSLIGFAFDLRINALNISLPSAIFSAIEWCCWDSHRDDGTVSAYIVSSRPSTWKEALKHGVQEMARMAVYGLTEHEFVWNMAAFLKDAQQSAEQEDTTKSSHLLEEIMEDCDIGHITVGAKREYALMEEIAPLITLEEVNRLAREIFGAFTGEHSANLFKVKRAVLESVHDQDDNSNSNINMTNNDEAMRAERHTCLRRSTDPVDVTPQGKPVSILSLFVTAPSYMEDGNGVNDNNESESEESDSDDDSDDDDEDAPLSAAMKKKESMLIPSAQTLATLRSSTDEFGASEQSNKEPLVVTREQVWEVIREAMLDVGPPANVIVPLDLITSDEIDRLVEASAPHLVPVRVEHLFRAQRSTADKQEISELRHTNEATGITFLELNNGIRVNYLHNSYRKNQCSIRLSCFGGQMWETGKRDAGASQIALQTLLDSGVANYKSEIVAEYCSRWGINFDCTVTTELLAVQMDFSLSQSGIEKVLQLFHLYLAQPRWAPSAFERNRSNAASEYVGFYKEIESVVTNELNKIYYTPLDHRFVQPTPERIRKLSPVLAQRIIEQHLLDLDNVEMSIVGDLIIDTDADQDHLELLLLRYLGTVPRNVQLRTISTEGTESFTATTPHTTTTSYAHRPPVLSLVQSHPVPVSVTQKSQVTWKHITDDEPRAFVLLAFACPNRLGQYGPTIQYGSLHNGPEPMTAAGRPQFKVPSLPGEELTEADIQRRRHVLWIGRCINLLCEIISTRLFTIVREKQGLLYDASVTPCLPDLYDRGHITINLSPFPEKISQTVEETLLTVLRSFRNTEISLEEFKEAQVPYVAHMQSTVEHSAYWMAHMEYLQQPHSMANQLKPDLTWITEVPERYTAITHNDIKCAALLVLGADSGATDAMCVSVGTAGPAPPADIQHQLARVRSAVATFNSSDPK
eukprot:TRINITY_DN6910_c0_g1_i1.p1 TRINITY_DN6910_c0_g1~~TRINITY_DN6910_c0_g1_i1.p1  ORF type:complete len:1277 (-),score=249.90 TRINITY_DN6910_c0_g1_i1:27-3806(-)